LLTLQGLVSLFEVAEREQLWLPMVQIYGHDKGVSLLTVHGSKGLEFEHVFITGVNACLWEKKRQPVVGYKFPDTLFSSAPTGDGNEELRRLFYVALTRAEKNLQVSYIKYRADGTDAEHSMFIEEIVHSNDLPVARITLPEEELMEFEALNYTCLAPGIEKSEEDFITRLLDKYVMNVTSLNTYLNCPLGFYFKNLLKIPSGKSENTGFGSAIHLALQKFFEDMQKNVQQQFPPKEVMTGYFKSYMARHRGMFSADAFARRLKYGQQVLADYYDNYIHSWNKIVSVERNINNILVKGVPLKGKIDKLEFNGKDVNVVDYKTGDVSSSHTFKQLSPPNDEQPGGGDYWRQAVFYKILVDNLEGKAWNVISTEFDFIEPGKEKGYQKIKLYVGPGDIETVTQQIATVWQKIQDRDFYKGCGKAGCHWCNFVKDNKLHVALHEISAEAEQEI
jgi:DNA helicase-2/ATP-dependent DNA helicase PcrA